MCSPAVMTRVVHRYSSDSAAGVLKIYRGFYGDDGPRAARLVLFCEDHNGNYWGWDPEDVTDPKNHECGIYRLDHSMEVIECEARNFEEFVRVECFSGNLEGNLPAVERGIKPRKRPFSRERGQPYVSYSYAMYCRDMDDAEPKVRKRQPPHQ